MSPRVAINGFGRISRNYLRRALQQGHTAALAHLLRYDSTYGRLDREVEHDESTLYVDGAAIPVTAHRDPAVLRWDDHGADIVIESTGRLRTREDAAAHLKAGARKVIIGGGRHGGT